MGANGSHASGSTNSDAGRNWKNVGVVGDVQIIQKKNPKVSNKLPEESHTPNRTYAIFEKDGNDVKAIAKYGSDGKKIWEIHTTDHDSIREHYHLWKDGKPEQEAGPNGKPRNKAYPLTPEMEKLFRKIRNYGD